MPNSAWCWSIYSKIYSSVNNCVCSIICFNIQLILQPTQILIVKQFTLSAHNPGSSACSCMWTARTVYSAFITRCPPPQMSRLIHSEVLFLPLYEGFDLFFDFFEVYVFMIRFISFHASLLLTHSQFWGYLVFKNQELRDMNFSNFIDF